MLPIKRYTVLITAVFLTNVCLAQETFEKRFKLTDDITEIFQVQTKNEQVKQGLFQAIYRKKTALASGGYVNNKKAGLWHYYNTSGVLLQNYDHNTNSITYEAPEDTTSYLRYVVDKQLDSIPKTTKPYKEGGRYFGYLPYINLFQLPKGINLSYGAAFPAVVELLISPFGRLADYKVHINFLEETQVFNMNVHLPNPDDMNFIPATVNGQPIACRIFISCILEENGKLRFR